jgi:hypothetical protein
LARATSKADKPASPQHASDWLVTMRAMAVQALRLKVNKECREAIQKGATFVRARACVRFPRTQPSAFRQATIWIR